MKSIKDGTFGYATALEEDPRLRQLIEANWGSISPILYSRTKAGLCRRQFRGEFGGAVPGGREINDFIHDAILEARADLLREWDGEYQSLVEFLWKIIERSIKRYAARCEARWERLSTTNPAEANAHVADISNVEQKCYEGPEDFASEREEVEHILKRFFGHRDYKIIEVMVCEGLSKPEDIAKRLGLDVGEVNNAKKRFRRDPYLLSLNRKRLKMKRKKGSKKRKGGGEKSP